MVHISLFIVVFFQASFLFAFGDAGVPLWERTSGNQLVFLGSAVRIQKEIPRARGGVQFLTASHVVENRKLNELYLGRGLLGLVKAELVYVDSKIDLAVLSADEMSPGLGLNLMSIHRDLSTIFPRASSTYHLPANIRKDKVVLRIVGIDPLTGDSRSELVLSPLVQTSFSGVPGRDDTGPLFQFEASDVPGVSGSIVSVFRLDSGKLATTEEDKKQIEECARAVCIGGFRPVSIGFVTMVSPKMNMVLAVPIPTIRSSLDKAQSLRGRSQLQFDRQTMGPGIYYAGSGIIHLKSDNIQDSSLSFRGSIQPAGASRGGDGGLAGALKASNPNWNSGIVFPSQLDKRWLQLSSPGGFYWTEFESFSEDKYKQSFENMNGIFEYENQLYISDPHSAWPRWLAQLEGDGTVKKCEEMTSNLFEGRNLRGARFQRSSRIRVCVEKKEFLQTLSISRPDAPRPEVVIEISLGEQTPSGLWPLIVKAEAQKKPMKRLGLRTFEVPQSFRLEIDYTAGLTLIKAKNSPSSSFEFEFSPVSR